MRFRVRTGIPWRDMPVEYGPWGRVCDLLRRWQRNGTWHQAFTRLRLPFASTGRRRARRGRGPCGGRCCAPPSMQAVRSGRVHGGAE
ncbi:MULTISPECIES: transposase [Streptomyces]|uniref:transposase n=1 Tax=Streptomyces TaxID=1883 RepID=UPI001E55A455|nr:MULTISPECIES: transposase [Streptomyces]